MKSLIVTFIIFLCILGNSIVEGQNRNTSVNKKSHGSINGVVVDEETREPLPGVNIIVLGTNRGTMTNLEGKFNISNLPVGTYSLVFSYIGYSKETIENKVVYEDAVVTIDVKLKVEPIQLKELVVTPGQFSILGAKMAPRQVLSKEDIQNMSWAEDITRAVARLPGVASSDYSSKFTVRGGESDEVLINLDGMELYEPFHQRDFSGGLFSIVDIETIEGIELMTGGFSAAYGNRLSGVFNMRSKHIEPGQRHTVLGLSVMNARLYTDGTFNRGKGSYLFSARRGMLDVLFNAAPAVEEATIDQGTTPKFYDIMGKVEFALSPKHTLSFHALRAGDQNKIEDISGDNFDKNSTSYENTYGWLTLKSTYNPNLFSRTILYSGLISHDRSGSFHKYEPSDKGDFSLSDKRDYMMFGVKQDWDWQASNNFLISTGYDVKHLKADYKYFSRLQELRVNSQEELYDFDRTIDISTNPSGEQIGGYISNRMKLAPKLVVEAGLRYDRSTYSNDNLWSPRLGVAYVFSQGTVLRGAWGYYYQSQFINNLDVNHGRLEFDPAELAKHYVIGLEHKFHNGIELRLESYYKELSNYSPQWQNLRDHLEMFPEARNDNALVVLNGATSKGIEMFLKYDKGGPITWWLSYALAKAEDDVETIDYDGLLIKRTGKVPRLNDQRHTVYADVNYRPNAKWHFNLSWQFYRGWPRTDYTYHIQTLTNNDLHFYPVHLLFNGVIYPAFHRMDLRVNRHFKTGAGNMSVFLHLINLYNRENLKKFDLDTRDDSGNYSIDQQGNYVPFHDDKYWFGFMPVLGVSLEF